MKAALLNYSLNSTLKLGATLKKLYLASQTIAVGLEQVILDRAVYGGDFLEQFATTENKLAMVMRVFIHCRNFVKRIQRYMTD